MCRRIKEGRFPNRPRAAPERSAVCKPPLLGAPGNSYAGSGSAVIQPCARVNYEEDQRSDNLPDEAVDR
jgi:hypothetical protein